MINKQCYFCSNNLKEVDYKNVEVLRTFIDQHARILKHGKTATCARHQRKLGTAIKNARFMALLPFIKG